jgi:phosphatidylserine decarboxylase
MRCKLESLRDNLLLQEDFNFLITNRIPRALLTHLMGRLSHIENPIVARICIAVWRLFTKLDLRDAKETHFKSLHACFTRELRPGARPIDPTPGIIVSPCDAIVGECGAVAGNRVFQAKGFPFTLPDLFGSEAAAAPFQDGCYAILRLTSAMYHRFHSPAQANVEHVTYISGDVWNVNPVALKRIEQLFCRNERATIRLRLDSGQPVALVAVAAVLVASIRLHFLNILLHLRWRGPNEISCDARVTRGQELGWFEHGSTIIVITPKGFRLCENIAPRVCVRMGQALMQILPDSSRPNPADLTVSHISARPSMA